MPTTRFEVEGIMDEAKVRYFYQEQDGNSTWLIMLSPTLGILIRLSREGDHLWFHSTALEDLSQMNTEEAGNLKSWLLDRNAALKVPHYLTAGNHVVVKANLFIEDGDLSARQFNICLGGVAVEARAFKKIEADVRKGLQVDSIDILMRQLCEGHSADGDAG